MSVAPDGTVTIEGSEGALEVTPASGSSGEGANVEAGVAAVDGSSAPSTDTVVRPEYNGVYLFTAIRDVTSPEEFSWHVKLGEGQELGSATIAKIRSHNQVTPIQQRLLVYL